MLFDQTEFFQINPTQTYNVFELAEHSYSVAKNFLDFNNLSYPRKFNTSASFLPACGLYTYRTKSIDLNLFRCKSSVREPNGSNWHFTGYKTDWTIPGVIAHEIGHHVENILEQRFGFQDIFDELIRVHQNLTESPITSFEIDPSEMFAESMRLFILNPDLLRLARPNRFQLIFDVFGLSPLHLRPWTKVLKFAHPRIHSATRNWIQKT